MRTPLVGGNWKMNLSRDAAVALARAVARTASDLASRPGTADIAIFPSFVHLDAVGRALCEAGATRVTLGSQDCYHEPDGAFTGEVSIAMLRDLGVRCGLTGHSERRHVLHETDALVNAKARALLDAGLHAVLCVGETLAQREDGATDAVNEAQLRAGLQGVRAEQTGRWRSRTAGLGDRDGPDRRAAGRPDAHERIRAVLADLFGRERAEDPGHLRGSVKASNVADLFAQPDIDGFLVGGAPLKGEEFASICRAAGG